MFQVEKDSAHFVWRMAAVSAWCRNVPGPQVSVQAASYPGWQGCFPGEAWGEPLVGLFCWRLADR